MAVVNLASPDDAYKAEVIERLEQLLERARAGEILSIVYACERPGSACTYGSTHIKDRYLLLGFLAHAMHMTHQSLDADATDETLIGDGA